MNGYQLCKNAEQKILSDKLSTLTAKEIDAFLDGHWLEYTCRYELSPCGDLTIKGKLEYWQANLEELQEMIKKFPVEMEMFV